MRRPRRASRRAEGWGINFWVVGRWPASPVFASGVHVIRRAADGECWIPVPLPPPIKAIKLLEHGRSRGFAAVRQRGCHQSLKGAERAEASSARFETQVGPAQKAIIFRQTTWRASDVDHIVVLGGTHLRRLLKSYARYYNEMRTHRSLDKDEPISRAVQPTGSIISHPLLGGLHHLYVRV